MSNTLLSTLNDGGSASANAMVYSSIRDVDGFGLGSMLLSAFSPGFVTRSGLTSSDTHVEKRPGMILGVLDAAGAVQLTIVYVGVAGAGEVLITYSSGVPTLVFGDGANTGYRVLKLEGPIGFAETMADTFVS